jgi:hypothetical protein
MQSIVFVLLPRSGVLQAYNITAFTFIQGRCWLRDRRASLAPIAMELHRINVQKRETFSVSLFPFFFEFGHLNRHERAQKSASIT